MPYINVCYKLLTSLGNYPNLFIVETFYMFNFECNFFQNQMRTTFKSLRVFVLGKF